MTVLLLCFLMAQKWPWPFSLSLPAQQVHRSILAIAPMNRERSLFFKTRSLVPHVRSERGNIPNTFDQGRTGPWPRRQCFREEFRDTRRCIEIRQCLHDRFDQWVDRLEAQVKGIQPTLEELTQAVLAFRQELTQWAMEGLVEQTQRPVLEQRTEACPQCGRMLSARGPVERIVETLVGAIRLRRPSCYCERCKLGHAPLGAVLGLTNRRTQPDVHKAVVKLTKEMPSETACELFEEWTGWPLSAHTAHEVTPEVAAGLTVLDVAPSREEMATKIAAVAAGHTWRPILVLAIDGADVPTRPETAKDRRRGRQKGRAKRARWIGEWREAKGFRFYVVADEPIEQVCSWHQIQTDEELAAALAQVQAAGLLPEEPVWLCVIGDGAPWIWKQAQALFPSAVEILDDYHCWSLCIRSPCCSMGRILRGNTPGMKPRWLASSGAKSTGSSVAYSG